MNVVCIGSGYVGSVTGTAFALLGQNTTIIDIDTSKVEMINSGKSPIYEPGLEALIQYAVEQKVLKAETSYKSVEDADVIFIGVGTPSKEDGTADLQYVKAAARDIGTALRNHKGFPVIINKSTVSIGTAEVVATIIEEASGLQAAKDFAVVSNPEFLREGYAVEDVFFPDRIVVGFNSDKANEIMQQLYARMLSRERYEEGLLRVLPELRPYMEKEKPVYFTTDTKSSEMLKYASNAFLAVKISYINEIAMLSERLGANALEVAKGMGLDSRIGNKFLEISSGWSGSCFPKDTAELLATSQKYNREIKLVNAAMEANDAMHNYVIEKIKTVLKSLNGKTVGILGLTFKPNTDDARKTQAEVIIRNLIDLGVNVRVHDPQGVPMFQKYNPKLVEGSSNAIVYCEQAEDVAERADAILLLTHWQEYLQIDWQKMSQMVRMGSASNAVHDGAYILDTRNFLDKQKLVELGFFYQGLGY
ncbi:nucleotide sugar dehydrogenase [Desulfuribacillus stibiiarsenatis]|uniref:UDP-glucose 6-dehydrogenase n=2 Tax=Desulfuribacillus stibiiarsenatis TaxID=1390249 RepID=A0A1E5L614_9FIRM|nr:nucleotide sugar dehydrogenase [Desulfuribacillus stibiiarsenatis]